MYWQLYADPGDARQKLASYLERYNRARAHWALVAAEPDIAPARVLTPHEGYVNRYEAISKPLKATRACMSYARSR